ncbi:hypothetical protein FEM48_Zijuj03G0126500 [Ziziphus jujuba var. spinosa]|uniref:PGG domain-containing protein n=1 Tax=Ziziphus jujuba var. spinosa TaxID=714518 RepID=A0A978VQC9_ZIZJJ|nr:hypothetical protein FEM48_Zijuj03G0126500 [Ziziphus jujuba var. spinosa]
MDTRLFEAAQTGNIKFLHCLLAENPYILHTIALTSQENPLHVSSIAGHVDFVKEILSYSGADAIGGLVNAVNKSGLTALDVLLIFPSEAGDREMEEILRNAGAKRAKDIIMSLSNVTPFEKSDNNQAGDPTLLDLSPDNLVNYFKFKRSRDSPSDARTALLVIAVLVTTATFQAGLNPPGTVWQDTGTTGLPHKAGRSILGSYDSVIYLFFMLFNTTGFGVSIYVISILISSFPLRWEFEVCIIALHFTYTTAITFMAPKRMAFPLMVFSIVFPLTSLNTSNSCEDNPLHIASTSGHVNFVKEMISLKPSFAKEVNQHRFSPLHFASAIRNLKVVKELLKRDRKLCQLEGRNRWTPLHYAASRGRVEIIREMVVACPESTKVVNVQKETALRLAIKNSQFDAVGDSIEIVEFLVGTKTNASNWFLVNAVNQSGLTALDVLLSFPSEAGIEKSRRSFGTQEDKDLNGTATTQSAAAYLVGKSILGSYSSKLFLGFVVFNSIGTYDIAMIFIAPKGIELFLVLVLSVLPAIMPWIAWLIRLLVKMAADTGNINLLHHLLAQSSSILHTIALASNENPLHIASTAGHVEFVKEMIRLKPGMKKDEILDMKDELGNSILHLATWRKHFQATDSRDGLVNAVNQGGLTALDILLIFPSEAGDREIEDILRHAGGRRANDIAYPAVTVTVTDNRTPVTDGWRMSDFVSGDLVKYFKFRRGRDSPSDARTALLVIAVLVATATFQAGLNPPGGVWQDTDLTGAPNKPAYLAGRSIMGSYSSVAYLLIMVPNCIGFSVSLFVISVLISNFPFQWEFQVCICALYFSYNTGITFMAPESLNGFLTAFSSALPGAMPLVIRLFEAAQTGNIQILHQLLAENPFILHTIELSSQGFNPLDIASTAGHVEFVKEIIRLRPDFAKQVNQDGFSPIHIAAAIGNMDTVREFMKVDQKLCRLEGRNRWTALHYAASRGKVDTIQEMLLACPESIEDVTVQNETALHLAVKNCQFQAINFMVVEWLISNPGTNPLPLEVNAVNKSGLTALDVLLIFASEAGDREIEEILRNAGARRARDMIMSLSTTPPYEITNNNIQTPSAANGPTTSDLCADNLVNYFKFKRGRDSPSDARTALLVIAVLVTTATFQAGLNPPGGVWQDTESNGGPRNPSHEAGRSIMGSYHPVTYLLFMVFNSIGFSISIYMITVLISNFPFLWEFRACVLALYFTYNIAITSMAPNSLKVFLTAFSSALPSLSPLIAKLVSKLIMASRGFLTHLKHRFTC